MFEDKRLEYILYKEFLRINNKNTNNPVTIGAKVLNGRFKKIYRL